MNVDVARAKAADLLVEVDARIKVRLDDERGDPAAPPLSSGICELAEAAG